MAKVYKRKYKSGNLSETYFFRATVEGKRITKNTGTTNKRIAEKIARDFQETGVLQKSNIYTPHSIVSLIEKKGWMNPLQNPKLKSERGANRNYGNTQARNIASAFNHMFNKLEYMTEFETFIRRQRILKYSTFEDWKNFLTKPAHTLNHQDAINFISFLTEYTAYLKENPMNKNHKFFMRQNKINIVALKSFFTYTVDVIKDKNLPENIFSGRAIPVNKKPEVRDFPTMEQLKEIFDDELANFAITGFHTHHVYRALKFSALTGLRSGEVRALHYSQFDIKNPNILTVNKAFKDNIVKKGEIGKPKWDKVRTIYICDSALECVGEIDRGKNLVFSNSGGGGISVSLYRNLFRKYLWRVERIFDGYGKTLLEGKNITPHSLRGGLNSYLLSKGTIGAHLIQDYFGWTKEALTEVQKKHYTTYTNTDSFKVAYEIEKGFSEKEMKMFEEENMFGEYKKSDITKLILKEKKPIKGFDIVRDVSFGTFDNADLIYPKEK